VTGFSHEKEHHPMSRETQQDWGQHTEAGGEPRDGPTACEEDEQGQNHDRAADPHPGMYDFGSGSVILCLLGAHGWTSGPFDI
jgi:hypothetical protein